MDCIAYGSQRVGQDWVTFTFTERSYLILTPRQGENGEANPLGSCLALGGTGTPHEGIQLWSWQGQDQIKPYPEQLMTWGPSVPVWQPIPKPQQETRGFSLQKKNNTKEVLDPGDSKYGIKTRELSESLYTEILSLSPLSCLLPECQQPDGCLCLCQAGYWLFFSGKLNKIQRKCLVF